jgi:hypothetical protein
MASRPKSSSSKPSSTPGTPRATASEDQQPKVPALTFIPSLPHLAPLKGEHASVGEFLQGLEELARNPVGGGKPSDAYTLERDFTKSPAPAWDCFLWTRNKPALAGTLHTQASIAALREQLGL